MQWTDRGIVLSVRRLGEQSAVIYVLTSEHGLHGGVDRGGFGKSKRGIYHPGNIVSVHWQARLPEQLGMISCELMEATTAHILDNRCKLAALASATHLTAAILAEREAQPEVHAHMARLMHSLITDADWRADYVILEHMLLASSGFGLDLERCAATGQRKDLRYVSPRSGRAVSAAAGEAYREKLFLLPSFLLVPYEENARSKTAIALAQIMDGLRLYAYFLETRVFAPRGHMMPAARIRFAALLRRFEEQKVF